MKMSLKTSVFFPPLREISLCGRDFADFLGFGGRVTVKAGARHLPGETKQRRESVFPTLNLQELIPQREERRHLAAGKETQKTRAANQNTHLPGRLPAFSCSWDGCGLWLFSYKLTHGNCVW